MDSQLDTAQQRAEALFAKVVSILDLDALTMSERHDVVQTIIAHDKQTRRDALAEARDYALACVHERATQLDDWTGSSHMAGVIRGKQSEAQRIADALDRLREGVEG